MNSESSIDPPRNFVATAARGVAPLLAAELQGFGVGELVEEAAGVRFSASLDVLYRCLIGSRVASRLLLPLTVIERPDADACYAAARAIDWPALFAVDSTFMVDVAGSSPHVAHTRFAGLRVKDAIADCFRETHGRRPDVDTDEPEVRVLLQLQGERARLSIDLGNGGLHRRGYRAAGGEAPLRENLAAALLLRAGWPEMAAAGSTLLDPFCGSGTLVIEAALMATHTAPGLLRQGFRPAGWLGHDATVWQQAMDEARAAVQPWPHAPLQGSDLRNEAVRMARANARLAGVEACTQFAVADALTVDPPKEAGLLISNPPYGERLASRQELIKLYSLLGTRLKSAFGGWRAALLVADDADSQRIGLRASARHRIYNGTLACHLLQFDLHEQREAPPPAAPDFANRLAKNMRHLSRWARRQGISCYRLYNADLTEYPLLVDRYEAEDGVVHLQVQEYAAPKQIDPARAEARLRGALAAICEVTGVAPARLHYKQRRAQKGSAQYQRVDAPAASEPFWVTEHGAHLCVDLDAYLDTGLFLDHRPLRRRLQQECKGLRMLNLFCYTGAASVHAALGGARQTVSVDLSNTYLEWARDNFEANDIAAEVGDGRSRLIRGAHALLRADCLAWLGWAQENPDLRFDRIFCDPPTFSNSKRTEEDFDIQRDHASLIQAAAALLAADGILYFSTNRRRFRMDEAAMTGLVVREITRETLDEDFRRPPPAHRCWQIAHGETM